MHLGKLFLRNDRRMICARRAFDRRARQLRIAVRAHDIGASAAADERVDCRRPLGITERDQQSDRADDAIAHSNLERGVDAARILMQQRELVAFGVARARQSRLCVAQLSVGRTARLFGSTQLFAQLVHDAFGGASLRLGVALGIGRRRRSGRRTLDRLESLTLVHVATGSFSGGLGTQRHDALRLTLESLLSSAQIRLTSAQFALRCVASSRGGVVRVAMCGALGLQCLHLAANVAQARFVLRASVGRTSLHFDGIGDDGVLFALANV